MTANVEVGSYAPFKPSSLKWDRNIEQISDSAKIVIPAVCRMKDGETIRYNVPTGLQFEEGQEVKIYAGYNGNNLLRFKGFISRINFKVPVEIDCEGYSYLLRKRALKDKSFVNTSVRAILEWATEGTGIKLSSRIPHIPIPKVWFKSYMAIQVLEWLKEKCLLTVYFNYDELYVGLLATDLKGLVKYRLNWNVIKDGELLFNAKKEFATVNIVVKGRSKNGHKTSTSANVDSNVKAGNEKVKHLDFISNPDWRLKIANDEKKRLNNKGYVGSITAFLFPYCEPGMATDIIDQKYNERNGRYFINSVSGSFDKNGGRQKVGILFSL